MEYWIDGYNLIGRARFTTGATLEQARDRLIGHLVPLGVPIRVYFDAAKAGLPNGSGVAPDPRVRVVFVRDRSADDAMVAELRAGRPKDVTLVTDDRELRGRAKQLGATTLGVDKFLAKIQVANAPAAPPKRPSATPPPAGDREKPSHVSKRDVDEWMKLFGFTEDGDPLDGPGR